MNKLIPDNSGRIFLFEKIDDSLPYTASLSLSEEQLNPVYRILEVNGIDYDIETDPDSYVCNSVLWAGIDATRDAETQFLFFHLPWDILIDEAKRDNLVKAIGLLTE